MTSENAAKEVVKSFIDLANMAKGLINENQQPSVQQETIPQWGFIKSSDHRPLSHQPIDQPTTDPATHRHTDPIITDPTDKILFQRIFKYSFYRKQTQL